MDLQTNIKQWIIKRLGNMPRGAKTRLAEYLGVTPTQVTKMLNMAPGKEHRNISVEELVKIADFFDCSLDELTGREDKNQNDDRLNSLFLKSSPDVQDAVLNFVEALVQTEKKK